MKPICDELDCVRSRHHHIAVIIILITFRQAVQAAPKRKTILASHCRWIKSDQAICIITAIDSVENQNGNDHDPSPDVPRRRLSLFLGKTSPEFECRASYSV